ncbi:sugar phosphate isomerase/epimerase [Paenibacillus alkaliterrae]|uniref:sugar phosphate isomerase/epimerase family protein n=1 Tax=Paenibacillus alkaliterrae TaxID=320909 RepID=UPI001F266417|nr:sugar phosphate isomerase/epimerase family protein [Paenibacillus alkaliterrae]MCF2941631.1 sugar phosphate isomerase/epimerase [Paenibacillus alkaliterrae]
MKLGIHAFAWCSKWTNETLHLIDRAKKLEMDFIEIPLLDLDTFDSSAIKNRLMQVGLEACTSTVLSADTDFTSDDPAIRQNGIEYLKACIRATSEIGATNFTGVIYSQHVKNATARPTEKEWKQAADCLREVAKYAQEYGILVGIEPVNRYETYLVNTAEQAMKLKEMVGEPNIKIHLDTYHMNIEEKSFYEATKLVGDDLIHYHLCENDRGIPGTGVVNWDDIFRALGEMNYQGYAALESFVDISDSMNTWVWRKLAPDGDTLVREAITFIRGMQTKYGL